MALLPRRLARGVTLGAVGVLVGCSAIPGLAPQAPRTTVTVISVVPQAPATETRSSVVGDWEGELDSRRSSFASDGWNVTSSKRTRLWQAVSGTQGDQIRYGRYEVNGPPVIGIEWTYPASQKARFDGLVTRAVRDLDITDSGG